MMYESYVREMSTMESTVESPELQEFLAELLASPFGPGTVGLVILQDSDEWAAPLVLAAAADCDGVHVFVMLDEEVQPVADWVAQLPHADRIKVHAAHNLVAPLPSLADQKRLRGLLGPALDLTHVYVPAGLGSGWRRWLESGQVDEPPINVVEVALPQSVDSESPMGVFR